MTREDLEALGMSDGALVALLAAHGIDAALDGPDDDVLQRRRRSLFEQAVLWASGNVSNPNPNGPKLSSYANDAPDVHEANRESAPK